MEMTSTDVQPKRFRTCWRGFDPRQVESHLRLLTEDIHTLREENAELEKTLQGVEKELSEYKEREKAIRNVLMNAHKTVEQMKSNAEKEAKLIVAEAEIEAERILQGAHQRLARLNEDITELRRQRIQFEAKFRATLAAHQQLLDIGKEEEREKEKDANYGERNDDQQGTP
jgi:cell division initiation protein